MLYCISSSLDGRSNIDREGLGKILVKILKKLGRIGLRHWSPYSHIFCYLWCVWCSFGKKREEECLLELYEGFH